MKLRILITAVLLLAVIGSFVACGSGGGDRDVIRVGSKNFTENLIVAEIYSLALEYAGYTVERSFDIAGALIHTAIINDEIDLYPEYTGTALLFHLGLDVMTDRQEVYDLVQYEYNRQFNLTWLDQTDVHNGQGLVIRASVAEELNIRTISDLQRHAEQIRFASQGEFDHREDGLPGLIAVYGPFNFLSTRVYDNALKYQVLENNEADLAPAYTTDGQLIRTDLFLLLEDDLHAWPPYYLAPVVRNEVLEAHPGIVEIINRVSATLNSEIMIALNAKVDVDQLEVEDVAREFFESIRHLLG